jgi:hypothetical protein
MGFPHLQNVALGFVAMRSPQARTNGADHTLV